MYVIFLTMQVDSYKCWRKTSFPKFKIHFQKPQPKRAAAENRSDPSEEILPLLKAQATTARHAYNIVVKPLKFLENNMRCTQVSCTGWFQRRRHTYRLCYQRQQSKNQNKFSTRISSADILGELGEKWQPVKQLSSSTCPGRRFPRGLDINGFPTTTTKPFVFRLLFMASRVCPSVRPSTNSWTLTSVFFAFCFSLGLSMVSKLFKIYTEGKKSMPMRFALHQWRVKSILHTRRAVDHNLFCPVLLDHGGGQAWAAGFHPTSFSTACKPFISECIIFVFGCWFHAFGVNEIRNFRI